jgi:hypothetical protein
MRSVCLPGRFALRNRTLLSRVGSIDRLMRESQLATQANDRRRLRGLHCERRRQFCAIGSFVLADRLDQSRDAARSHDVPTQLDQHRMMRACKIVRVHRSNNCTPLVSFGVGQRRRRVRPACGDASRNHKLGGRFSSSRAHRSQPSKKTTHL